MSEQNQARFVEVFNYLWNNTDRRSYATIVDIQKHLESLGIEGNRKTIAGDIRNLQRINGIDIECIKSTQNRYYISRRFFDEPVLRILCDTVRSSYFLSESKSREILKILSEFAGPDFRKELKSPALVDTGVKTGNNDAVKYAYKIAVAVAEGKKIRFRYFDYSKNREIVYKHDGKVYEVSPYSMVINDGKYYIAAYEEETDTVKTFRIDKMEKLKVTKEPVIPAPASFNVKKFAASTKMIDGYMSEVELLCDNSVMFNIIDKFGADAVTETFDEDRFTVKTQANISPAFFGWIVGFGGKIKVKGPAQIIDEYNSVIRSCGFNC